MNIGFIRVLYAGDYISDMNYVRFDTLYNKDKPDALQLHTGIKPFNLPIPQWFAEEADKSIAALRAGLSERGIRESECVAPDDIKGYDAPPEIREAVMDAARRAGLIS